MFLYYKNWRKNFRRTSENFQRTSKKEKNPRRTKFYHAACKPGFKIKNAQRTNSFLLLINDFHDFFYHQTRKSRHLQEIRVFVMKCNTSQSECCILSVNCEIGGRTYSLDNILSNANQTFPQCKSPITCALTRFMNTTLNEVQGKLSDFIVMLSLLNKSKQ